MEIAVFTYIKEIELPEHIVDSICVSGANDIAVAEAMELDVIKDQLKDIDSDDLRKELSQYGAWDEEQLNDHDNNLQRLIWIAAWNIFEES